MSKLFKTIEDFWKQCSEHSEAKSFKKNQNREDAYDARDRGIRTIPLVRIVGSVGRYHDFDRQFRLRQHLPSEKLQHVKELMRGGVPLPPVKLYQIKNEYYVLDGNHRVAAAKELGREQIEACIVEFLPSPITLENILYREKIEFLEKSGLQAEIELTEVGQYPYLLHQIQSHQHFLEQHEHSSASFQGAAADWLSTIYHPLVRLIQHSHLLEAFPQRTIADLYTYISSHQWQKGASRVYGKEIDHFIPNDMEEFRVKMAKKQGTEYPEMQREITVFVLMNVDGKRESRIIEKLFAFEEVREIHSVHGNIDIVAKIVLTRDLLTSDAETISYFVNKHIRQLPGVMSTQTLIPGISKIKRD